MQMKSNNKVMIILFYFIVILGLHLQHVEDPCLGIKSELQLLPRPQPQQYQIQVPSVYYTAACGNTRSLTH